MSGSKIVLKLWTIAVYGFLFAPIVMVAMMSFNASKYSTFPISAFTFDWYDIALHDRNILIAVQNSLIISLSAALGSTIIGTLAAMAIVRNVFRGREFLKVFFLSPMVIPEIIIGIALLSFATSVNIKGGIPLIIIGHILYTLPFAYTVISSRLYGFDRSLEEAAMDLGAHEWTTFRKITLPLIAPGIVGGAILAFTVSFDDFMITYLLAGSGVMTIPVQIYSMVRLEINPKVHALSTGIMIISMMMVIIHQRLIKPTAENKPT